MASGLMEHWVDIDPERLERYRSMFQWTAAAEEFYAPAAIGAGHVVADFGCGPGHASVEFARRVGDAGHVHALDINADFIAMARANAAAAGLDRRITAHLLSDVSLPLPDGSLDRIVARNTIIYVEDPVATFTEFRRVLRPGGLAHAIESDWSLTLVEPVPSSHWKQLIDAASWVWPRPEIGRRLYGIARQAGFDKVDLQVLTIPDTDGRLHGMIETVAGYARTSGQMDGDQIASLLQTVDQALSDGTYLAVAPQFLVTATR